jgi:hypothetical protein
MRQPRGCLGLGLFPAIPHPHLRATWRHLAQCQRHHQPFLAVPHTVPHAGCCELCVTQRVGTVRLFHATPGCGWLGREGMLSSFLSSAGLWSPLAADDGAQEAATPAEQPVAETTDAPDAPDAGEAAAPWLHLTALQAALEGHRSSVDTLRALQNSLAEANARAFAAEQHVQRLLREQAARKADCEAAVLTSPRAKQGEEAPLSPADVDALQAALKEALHRAEAAESTLATQQAWHASELEAVRAEAARDVRELEGQLKAAQAAANAALAVADRARREASSGSLSAVVAVSSSGDASPGGGRLAALSAALEAERQRAAQAEKALRTELEWATAETEAQVVMAKREVAMQAHEEISRLRAALAAYEEQLRDARSGGGHVAGEEQVHAPIEAGMPNDAAAEAGLEVVEAAQATEAAAEEPPAADVCVGVSTEPADSEAADAEAPAPAPLDASEEAPLPDESGVEAPDDLDTEPVAESVASGVETLNDTTDATPPDVAPDPPPGEEQQAEETDAGPAGEAAADEGQQLLGSSSGGRELEASGGPHTARSKPQAGRKNKLR